MKRILMVLITLAFSHAGMAATLTFNAIDGKQNGTNILGTVIIEAPAGATKKVYTSDEIVVSFDGLSSDLTYDINSLVEATFSIVSDGITWSVDGARFMSKELRLGDLDYQGILTKDILLENSTPAAGGTMGQEQSFIKWSVAPVTTSAVPIPAAAFMLAPALLGLLGLRCKKTPA